MITAIVETESEEGTCHARLLDSRDRRRRRRGSHAAPPAAAPGGQRPPPANATSKPGAASRGARGPDISCNLVCALHCYVKTRRGHSHHRELLIPPRHRRRRRRGAVGRPRWTSDLSMRRLHPLLQTQLRELRARVTGGRVSAHELLEMLSRYYDTIDDERRAMVRSMQLMSDEARSLGVEIAEQGAAQLQVILDHIKDVVITANAEGIIDRANPMTERVFGYPPGELLGRASTCSCRASPSTVRSPPGLERLAGVRATRFAACASAREVMARRSDGTLFPAEIAVSRARHGRSEVFVICLRDISDRHNTQQALRDSEARYRSLVDNAPEAITVIDADSQALRRSQRTGVAAVQDDARSAAARVTWMRSAPRCSPTGSRRCAPRQHLKLAAAGESQVFEWMHRDSTGRDIPCEVRLVRLPGGRRRWCAPASPTSPSASAPRSSWRTSARSSRCSRPTPACRPCSTSSRRWCRPVYPRCRCTISVLAPDGELLRADHRAATAADARRGARTHADRAAPRIVRGRGVFGLRGVRARRRQRRALGRPPPGGARLRGFAPSGRCPSRARAASC